MDFRDKIIEAGLTFSDISLRPQKSNLKSRLDPDTFSYLTKKIKLAVPIISANMDTVTESTMAIAMARYGGIGIIHRNMSIEDQVKEVLKVKSADEALIRNPYTLFPENLVWQARELLAEKQIDSVLIIDKKKKLVGLVTKHELAKAQSMESIEKYMLPRRDLIVAEINGKSLTEKDARILAEKIFAKQHLLGKLPFIDKKGNLVALLIKKDLLKEASYPSATKNELGRLRVGAAIGVSEDTIGRAQALVNVGVDVLVLDIAHGHAVKPMEIARLIRRRLPNCELIVGNVATKEAVRDYARLNVSAIKVGIGPGATCSTRIVSGAGVPQVSALLECVRESQKFGIPIIADGGIRYPRDVSIAIGCGASSVMIGTLFAGTDESPGDVIHDNGRLMKIVRGMSSLDVNLEIKGDKFMNSDLRAVIQPEGETGRISYRGPLIRVLGSLVSGLRSGMTYAGAANIKELQRPFERKFTRMSQAAWEESKPHDIEII
ncbi:MAG: IMP dehydrogenase [Parcubacteria group bacterium]|nr:IMP dehydrogenase [Parcubacteria group bacterium]